MNAVWVLLLYFSIYSPSGGGSVGYSVTVIDNIASQDECVRVAKEIFPGTEPNKQDPRGGWSCIQVNKKS